ncbi:uncharacterized protein LOC135499762 [Lineus longissimus]|uniref:uncharacterized protein LOC135499762 n=1 Tax=Lineus longissimus TaxID=88925 RepID=UPI00315CA5C9
MKDYHSLKTLLRVTAMVQKAVKEFKGERPDIDIDANAMNEAELLWIKTVQTREFKQEIHALNKPSAKRAPLVQQLQLFLDAGSYLRLNGRLNNAPIREETKFPLLLPRKHHFTDLMVRHAHWTCLHTGTQGTVTHPRQRYWIPRIREVVFSIVRKCVACKRVTGKPYKKPVSPPLQAFRLQEANPFQVCGCNFTGALYVLLKGKSDEIKVYVCLFTCAVTRAIHLELVPDMTTASFLNAFRRFTARRSVPSQMISDNATTFESAASELKKLKDSLEVKTYMANHRITWTFNPKRAPGGEASLSAQSDLRRQQLKRC